MRLHGIQWESFYLTLPIGTGRGQGSGVEVFMVIFAMDLIEGLLKPTDPSSEKYI
jgi:hypothetical protein